MQYPIRREKKAKTNWLVEKHCWRKKRRHAISTKCGFWKHIIEVIGKSSTLPSKTSRTPYFPLSCYPLLNCHCAWQRISSLISVTYSCLLAWASYAQRIVGDTQSWGTSFSLFDEPLRRWPLQTDKYKTSIGKTYICPNDKIIVS